ncbi:Translation initiation factor 2 [hydrothermal vent metagenome]|uniref:Translation initiation factor 2 n=1 Tax=hydrothermal vent metagenome TaxID=652676 RepID=A0A1W1E9Z5_9ZZZZ
MDKVKIQEVAAEAGLSNSELLAKAKELGFDVKAANSTISLENAGILVDYAISGTLPKGFEKPGTKKKMTVVKKVKKEENASNVEEAPKAKENKEATESINAKKVEKKIEVEENKTVELEVSSETEETPKEESISAPKEVKKRKGISIVSKKAEPQDTIAKTDEASKPKRKTLSRSGIKIVKKAKPAPSRTASKISMADISSTPTPSKKKIKKGPAQAKDTGKKIDIFNHDSLSGDIDSGFGEEEVVLLDFSDKNIYEEMMRQEQKRKEEAKKRELAAGGPAKGRQPFRPQQKRSLKRGGKRKKYHKEENKAQITSVEIPENVRVYEFAEKVGKTAGDVIKVLFALGMMVTKNDFLSKDEIEILAEEFEVEVTTMNPLDELDYVAAYDAIEDDYLEERPPVITIMGHVDHGKTSLLDKIRSAKVADKEAGGITQHVGAYQVEKNGKKITFVDTPGHEAFTEMRARGAQATDIVIIVVAADDGVMPQTKEAIAHTKAAGVPMIVAINKMDKPNANPDNVKAQLAEIDVMATDWGGEYEFIPVSAHTGEGIDDLLETILLQAEVMELQANPNRKAKAIVVESSLEKGFGPVANVIIKNGTLNVGDNVIVGQTYGRVRVIKDDNGKNVKSAPPSAPVAVVGLNDVPGAGDVMVAMDSEKEVRELAEKRAEYERAKQLSKSTKASLEDLSALIAEGQLKSLPVIIKADVQGSLEAIKGSLEKLRNEEVKVNIIHEGVGGVTESDVTLADASEHAVILGFNVRPTGAVKKKAKELGVEINTYTIIYDLLDDVKALLGGLMSPVIKEEVTGQAEVRETFVVGKVGTIAGCKVTEGSITRNSKARLIRDGVVVYESSIASLKRFNEDAKEVKNGYECGIMLENFNDIKEGDVIETFKDVEEQVTL